MTSTPDGAGTAGGTASAEVDQVGIGAPEARPADHRPPGDPPADPGPPGTSAGGAGLPDTGPLSRALGEARAAVAAATYPLPVPSAPAAAAAATALRGQLDDYLLPRLRRLDAPLLVVVGGSTGAGKSTLVNSVVRETVTTAGVLRPTTRAPVLVCHPDDEAWFRGGDLLPGLTRTPSATAQPATLHLRPADAVPAGLALLDAPDIDSVVDDNRALAVQLLAAADLWLFVTTAARYADAVPWGLLRTAVERGTATALVLDRVPPAAAGEVAAHLREMLDANDLGQAPLFVLPEAPLDLHGRLGDAVVGPVRDWLTGLAADQAARAAVVRQSLDGALAALPARLTALAAAADAQAGAVADLTGRLDTARATARDGIARGLHDGTLLRGEVLARWQEFVGTGDLMRALETRVSRLRDRLTSVLTGRPAPERTLRGALESSLGDLLRGTAADATEQAYRAWTAHPAGAALCDPALARPGPDLDARAQRLVRDWQRGVLDLVRAEGTDRRARARGAAYAVNALSLVVMISVFASTAFIPTGAEVAAGAGSAVAGQKLLEAVFGDQAIRALAAKARADLVARADALVAEELARFAALLAAHPVPVQGPALRAAAAAVAAARADAALVPESGPAPLPPVAGVE